MTLKETRQLGIEFERRVQTMIPETEMIAKLDTETIYSFLNQYQDKLIQELYRTIDQIPISNNQLYMDTLLHSLLSSTDEPIRDDGEYVVSPGEAVTLPDDFGLYKDSYTTVTKSYGYKNHNNGGIIPNSIIASKDASTVMNKPYDNMRILRSPIVWLEKDKKLHIFWDRYTEPVSVRVNYYKIPNYMNLLTNTPCELPMEMFEPLVSGAVDLYVQYVAGAEARKRQQQEAQQRRNKKEDEQ